LRGENCGRVEIPYPLEAARSGIFAVLGAVGWGNSLLKDELMFVYGLACWSRTMALEVHICAVRKALGPDRGTLKTSFGRGYLLVGDWKIRKERHGGECLLRRPSPIAQCSRL